MDCIMAEAGLGKSLVFSAIFTAFCIYFMYATVFLPPEPLILRKPPPRSPDGLIYNISTTASTVTDLSRTTIEPVPNCTSTKTVVFIKSHKTGSTTLQTIVNRFGFFHNLSFVFNKRSSINGHFYFLPITTKSPETYFLPPLKVRPGDYKNYKNYDMLAVHVRYNRKAMDTFMKKGTKYISIIREPSTQWESAFNQFLFEDAFPNAKMIPPDKWIETFLQKPSYYRERLRYLSYEGVMGRRYYYAQNSQAYDLGLDVSAFYNETIINATIANLEQEFALILVLEYFDESLLILKNELCWDYEDIVYFPKNLRASRQNLSDEIITKIRDFNYADVLLYDYFNKTLWKKIEEYGPTFEEDLNYFRKLNHHIFEECGSDKPSISKLGKRIIKHVEFSPKKNVTLFCQTVAEHKRALFDRVYQRQNQKKPTRSIRRPKTAPRRTRTTTHLLQALNANTKLKDILIASEKKPNANDTALNSNSKSGPT